MGLLYYVTIHSNTAPIVFSVRKSDYDSSWILQQEYGIMSPLHSW